MPHDSLDGQISSLSGIAKHKKEQQRPLPWSDFKYMQEKETRTQLRVIANATTHSNCVAFLLFVRTLTNI